MPQISGLRGRLLIAFTLILLCVAVGFMVVYGNGGNQRPAADFGDLAATMEARRTANAPTATPTPIPTPQPTVPSAHLEVAVDSTQAIPLLTIGNQGYSDLAWRLWGVYRSPLGSAKPLRVAVLGADAFDTFLVLEADAGLASDFRFVNEGDDWTAASIQTYDLLVVNEAEGGLSGDEAAALAGFQASGRGVILGIGQLDNFQTPVYNYINTLFGVDGSTTQGFAPGVVNPAHPLGQSVTLATVGGLTSSLHVTSAEWVVQGHNGATFVAAQESEGRTILFGGSLVEWLASNPGLVRQALHWAGNGWIFLQPLSGQVAAQSSQVITALLDTSGFFAGTHLVDVVVESNDPATPRLRVPMRLQVSGTPRLGVDGALIEFDQVYVGYDQVRTLRIDNPGVAELEVALTADDAAISLQPQRFVLMPRASQTVAITFRPRVSQTVASTIRIASNDPISPTWQVEVVGEGIVPPKIALLAVDQALVLTRPFTTSNAQIEVGAPQVERPTPSPTATTVQATPNTATPVTGGPSARPTPSSTSSIRPTPATPVAPTAQSLVVATPSITPSSTATPGPTPDSSSAATETSTAAPMLVIAHHAGESPTPILAAPDGDAAVLALLAPGYIFLASARTPDTQWLYGHATGTTLTGWIAVQQLILIGDPQLLPILVP